MKKLLKKARSDFLDYLGDIRGYSDLTLKSYDEAIGEMLTYSDIQEDEGILRINLMPFRVRIAGLKAKTIAKKLSAIRSFTAYMKKEGIAVVLRADESVKVPKTLPKPIAHEHIMKALEGADLQERLIVLLLYTLGLRISELSGLKLEQIGTSWVRVMGKGQKEREVPLLESVSDMIRVYREQESPRRFLFERRGAKLSENSLRYMLSKLFEKSGMKVTPHQLRHAYATELLAHHARIADVSELLGHASMATTQIYTKLGSALKLENYVKAHPLCKENSEANKPD